MKTKQSAGLLVYRKDPHRGILVFLVHPGGPFYKNKDAGAWSIPKGEVEDGEEPLAVAMREFIEETGNTLEATNYIPLQTFKLKSGKLIHAWAAETTDELVFISSNQFTMVWPPKSGKVQSFDEVDSAAWFTLDEARQKLNPAQVVMLDQLQKILDL